MIEQIQYNDNIKVVFLPDYIFKALKENGNCLAKIAGDLNTVGIEKFDTTMKDTLSLEDRKYLLAMNLILSKVLDNVVTDYKDLETYYNHPSINKDVITYLEMVLFPMEDGCTIDNNSLREVLRQKNNMREYNDNKVALNSYVINNVIFVILSNNVISFMSINGLMFKRSLYKLLMREMFNGFEEAAVYKNKLFSKLVYGLIK